MALNAYLKMKGQKTGDFKGSVTQKGREGLIKVVSADHLITSPRDLSSGQATGKRQHQPIVITKEIDRSTPLLHAALVTGEIITEWRLDFWRPSATGVEVQAYTIQLVNAAIVSLKLEMLNNEYPENANIPERERVAFVYQKIVWTWTDGGITAMDDWAASSA
jgi:type VI secretion system secreted protein Hcp